MMMRRSLAIFASGASLAAVSLLLSEAPARVHIVELGILLPVAWVGAWLLMAYRHPLWARTLGVLGVVVGAALARAYLLPLVVLKAATGLTLFVASFLLLGGSVVVAWLLALLFLRAGIVVLPGSPDERDRRNT